MESTAETYANALKKVSTKTKDEQYMLMEFSYDKKCIIPLKQAVTIIECLENAILLEESYSGAPAIKPLENEFTFRMFSGQELKDVKVASLLGLTLREVKSMPKHT